MPSLIRETLRSLRKDRGFSRSALSRRTVSEGFAGVPEATIEALETNAGQVPAAETIRALAGALDVEPGHFYEWPIAEAREDAKTRLAQRQAEAARRTRARRGSSGGGTAAQGGDD